MDKSSTAFVYKAILEATKEYSVFPHLEWIDEQHMRVELVVVEPDQKKLGSLREDLERLIVEGRYVLTSDDYMAALEENEKQTKIFSEQTKKAAEIGLMIDQETEEKTFAVRIPHQEVTGFVLKKQESLDTVLDFIKTIAAQQARR